MAKLKLKKPTSKNLIGAGLEVGVSTATAVGYEVGKLYSPIPVTKEIEAGVAVASMVGLASLEASRTVKSAILGIAIMATIGAVKGYAAEYGSDSVKETLGIQTGVNGLHQERSYVENLAEVNYNPFKGYRAVEPIAETYDLSKGLSGGELENADLV